MWIITETENVYCFCLSFWTSQQNITMRKFSDIMILCTIRFSHYWPKFATYLATIIVYIFSLA
jgi:hypothetical protein